MKAPKLQFSLATLLALMCVAAAIACYGDKLLSEAAFAGIWLATLLIAGWRTQSLSMRGWKKALRVTLITGAVWTVCIVGTHIWSASVYSCVEVLVQAVKVTIVGVALAFFASFLLLGIHTIINCWRAASWRSRFRSLGLLMGVLGLVWGAQWVWNFNCWEPTVIISESDWNSRTRREQELVAKQRTHPWIVGSVEYSPDASTMAFATQDGVTLVTAAGESIARFDLPDDQHVESSLLYPEKKVFYAVVAAGDGSYELVRWDNESGKAATPVSLDKAFDVVPPGKAYPLLINHRLLILFVEGGSASLGAYGWLLWTDTPGDPAPQVQLWSLDLEPKIGNPRSFPALARLIGAEARPLVGSGPRSYDSSLRVSPNGNWMARGVWLYGPDGAPPIKLRGGACGFLAPGDRVAVQQVRRLPIPILRRPNRGPTDPPFWKSELHFALIISRHRIVVFDCEENRILARTRWYFANGVSQTHQGRWLVLRQFKNVLLWDLHQPL